MKDGLYIVDRPWVCGGVVIKKDKVIDCAPYFLPLKKWKKALLIDFLEVSARFVEPL
jgi:hypothetical protein